MLDYEPLFLKYRPQSLSDLIGQDSVKATLVNAIKHNKLVHAYLFTGPRGAGKTSTARILAKCLNCQSTNAPALEPCGSCPSCVSIASSSSMDVIEIDAASHGLVADARLLTERVHLSAVSGLHKVYIIDEVHMLTKEAFNALLKVFEEPPEKVVFILATTEEEKVLPTIRSRCQQLKFRPISVKDSMQRLQYIAEQESINIEDEAIKIIANHADGAMRDAISLLDQVSVFSETTSPIKKDLVLSMIGELAQEDLVDILSGILERNPEGLLSKLDDILAQGKETHAICKGLINLTLELLENLHKSSDGFSPLINQLIDQVRSSRIENFELVQIIDKLSELEIKLKSSSQSKNLLKAYLLRLIYRQDMVVMRDILAKLDNLEPQESSAVIDSATSSVLADTKPAKQIPEKSSEIDDFTAYLSPACKGIYVSSQAKLVSTDNSKAVIWIPVRFKFLKTKLEAKSQELIEAINKSGQAVTSLVVEVTDADTLSSSPSPQTSLSSTAAELAEQFDELGVDFSGHTEPLQVSPRIEQELSSGEPCFQRSARLDEAVRMGLNVFGGSKELKR
jgi:DNA polymerase-3 subunit gamma/tau